MSTHTPPACQTRSRAFLKSQNTYNPDLLSIVLSVTNHLRKKKKKKKNTSKSAKYRRILSPDELIRNCKLLRCMEIADLDSR